MSEYKIVFMGTPEFAALSLENIITSGFNVVAVVTSADKPAGRGQKIQKSAVKLMAEKYNLNILQPTNLKSLEFQENLRNLNADLFVVIAFRMLPEMIWSIPKMGTINLHASLLPAYRGAAPINRAIMNGETKTGITTFFIEKEIDTGDIIHREEVAINEDENAGELHDKLMLLGSKIIIKTINSIFEGNYIKLNQNTLIEQGENCYLAPKIFKENCEIDWNQKTKKIYDFIRGLSPYPAAWTNIEGKNKLMLKIYLSSQIVEEHNKNPSDIFTDNKSFIKIATIDGYISLLELQLEGKKKMKTEEFLRGFKISEFIIKV